MAVAVDVPLDQNLLAQIVVVQLALLPDPSEARLLGKLESDI
jgi:hypothetical protein